MILNNQNICNKTILRGKLKCKDSPFTSIPAASSNIKRCSALCCCALCRRTISVSTRDSSYIMTYQSISINHPHDDTHHIGSDQTQSLRRYRFIIPFTIGSLLYITFDWLRLRLFYDGSSVLKPPPSTFRGGSTNENTGHLFHSAADSSANHSPGEVPIPTGVNLGSWLSLEDWFYVGSDGAVEVASPDDALAASCLPPLHLDESTGPRWNSETDLLDGLGECLSFALVFTCFFRFRLLFG